MKDRKIVITDTETASMTGPVCDLALVEIDEELNIIGEYESLVDPERPMAPAAQEVHGITDDDVKYAPTMKELIERDGNPFHGGKQLIVFGHNVQFDCRMLADILPEDYTKGCTLRMARNMWPNLKDGDENHKLGTLAIMFGLKRGTSHRAMGDVMTCLELLRYIADVSKVSSFDELLALGTKPLSLETKISFGKHKGTKLGELPLDYVRWICNQTDMDPDLRAALAVRLKKA